MLKLAVQGSSALGEVPGCGQKQQVSVCVTTDGCAVGCWGAAAFGGVIGPQRTSAQLRHSHDLPRWEWACHEGGRSGQGLQVPGTWHWLLGTDICPLLPEQ